MAHIILFEHTNFRGDHRHIFQGEPDLNANGFGHKVSSIAVIEAGTGGWAVYNNPGFPGDPVQVLGEGLYPDLSVVGINNDSLSSVKAVKSSPTVTGKPVTAQILLFQDAHFRGAHKHVLTEEDNLNASEDDDFNDEVSSLVVLKGNWQLARNAGLNTPYEPILGRGGYAFVGSIGIQNDDISSLKPGLPTHTTLGTSVDNHVVLFEDAQFRGAHKHVFQEESNLNASEDSDFNDEVSSIAVLSGQWRFFGDAGFNNPYPPTLGPGRYSFVGDHEIKNDDMSSLRSS